MSLQAMSLDLAMSLFGSAVNPVEGDGFIRLLTDFLSALS